MENKEFIKQHNYGNVTVVENRDYQWAVIDNQGNFVVPFGKYTYIGGFEKGLARVHTAGDSGRKADVNAIEYLNYKNRNKDKKLSYDEFLQQDRKMNPNKYAKWGIINEKGEEVLPVIYDDVWNFYGKNLHSVTVEKDGVRFKVPLHTLNPSLSGSEISKDFHLDNVHDDDYPYNEPGWGSYDEYGGYNGYDDYTIDSAFDGDPEATWNID